MSKIILKRSSEPNKIPLVSDLVFGELALNYADGILYYKDTDNAVHTINGSGNSDRLINGDKIVTLGSNGSLTFPTQPTNARTGNAEALLFNKDNTQKAIGTQSGTESNPTVERLVITGGDGFNSGEGGDIYLWAGRSGQSGGGAGGGGDIKVDAGDAYNSYGGTVKIRGGNGYDGSGSGISYGGWVEVTGGSSWNGGDGANITLTAGNAYGQGGNDGNVVIYTGKGTHSWNFRNDGNLIFAEGSSLGMPEGSGTVGFVSSTLTDFLIETSNGTGNTWVFGKDGNLSLPGGGDIVFGDNTSISLGMGFHIRSNEGVSLEAVDTRDSTNTLSRGWYVSSDGELIGSDADNYHARAAITVINFPAEDSGFGLTTPDGVTHEFRYDYDGSYGSEIPILVIPGVDTIQDVVTKTIAAIYNQELFGDIHWDAVNNCIWIYQYLSGATGNQTNTNYGYTDGISSFTGAVNGSIVFGDGTVQSTAVTTSSVLNVIGDGSKIDGQYLNTPTINNISSENGKYLNGLNVTGTSLGSFDLIYAGLRNGKPSWTSNGSSIDSGDYALDGISNMLGWFTAEELGSSEDAWLLDGIGYDRKNTNSAYPVGLTNWQLLDGAPPESGVGEPVITDYYSAQNIGDLIFVDYNWYITESVNPTHWVLLSSTQLRSTVTNSSSASGSTLTLLPFLDETVFLQSSSTPVNSIDIQLPTAGNVVLGQVKIFQSSKDIEQLAVFCAGGQIIAGLANTSPLAYTTQVWQCIDIADPIWLQLA